MTPCVGCSNIEQVYPCQPTLFATGEPEIDPDGTVRTRTVLDHRSWIDHTPGWLRGDQALFDHLGSRLNWRQRQGRIMFDSLVDEPRLTSWWSLSEGDEPHPVLAAARTRLCDHYDRSFDSIGFNLYRDGSDSVAWHGDRHRHHVIDPVVAILSLGTPRTFRVRPRGGGRSRSWEIGHGDLLVMGGACQHEWEHTVPKTRRRVGPRLSVTFRHGAARDAAPGPRRTGPVMQFDLMSSDHPRLRR